MLILTWLLPEKPAPWGMMFQRFKGLWMWTVIYWAGFQRNGVVVSLGLPDAASPAYGPESVSLRVDGEGAETQT